jgi:hypothetical protein
MQKNVDYAAYEYNVYLRCELSWGERKKKRKRTPQDSNEEMWVRDGPIG